MYRTARCAGCLRSAMPRARHNHARSVRDALAPQLEADLMQASCFDNNAVRESFLDCFVRATKRATLYGIAASPDLHEPGVHGVARVENFRWAHVSDGPV